MVQQVQSHHCGCGRHLYRQWLCCLVEHSRSLHTRSTGIQASC
ncbi:hypothetical protein CGRA01v4_12170 [Colletotrichum graminicola]|nr:hypothetical protein CGRA01v4_12170 [Colletotrichum graminicola]